MLRRPLLATPGLCPHSFPSLLPHSPPHRALSRPPIPGSGSTWNPPALSFWYFCDGPMRSADTSPPALQRTQPPSQHRSLPIAATLSLPLSIHMPGRQPGILPSCSTTPLTGGNGIIKTQVKRIITTMEPFYLTVWDSCGYSPKVTWCLQHATERSVVLRSSGWCPQRWVGPHPPELCAGALEPGQPCCSGTTGHKG